MHLLSLEVRHWRGLEHVHLEDFSEGLNLVFGPNEAGKSRLFQALRFGLWESYKGEAAYKKALAGWACSEPPWVAVEFSEGKTRYRVEKRFLKGSYAKLEGGGETLKDEAAENKLRQLLEVGSGGGRRTDELAPADRGLWRLLWISQGESRGEPSQDFNEEPRSNLQQHLSQEVGEVTAGPFGQHLLARARGEADRYWTASFKPKSQGELGLLLREVAEALSARDEAASAREALAAEVQELERCRRNLASLEPRLAALKERREAAERRAEAAKEARAALDTHLAHHENLKLRLDRAVGESERHRRLRRESEEIREESDQLGRRLGELEARRASRDAELTAAGQDAETAHEARETAAEALRRQRSLGERRRLVEEKDAAQTRYDEGRKLQDRLRELTRRLAGLPIDRPGLEKLEGLERAWVESRARLEGASAGVSLRALRPLRVTERGLSTVGSGDQAAAAAATASEPITELAAGETLERRLAEPAELSIEGVAVLSILPGGEGLSELRDQVRDRERAFRSAAHEARVADLEEARSSLEERRQAEQEAKTARALLDHSAPQGLDRLQEEIGAFEARLAQILQGPSAQESSTVSEIPIADLERHLEEAEDRLRQARSARESLAESLREDRTELAVASQAAQRLRQQLLASEAQLAEGPSESEAVVAVEALERQVGESSLEAKAFQERFDKAGGDGAEDELAQVRRALDRLSEERESLGRQAQRLEGQIAAREGAGLYEALQERERELLDAQARLSRLEVRSAAAKKLWQTLEHQRQQAQHRLTEPVRRRIEPYLVALFPGSGLSLGEDWQVRGLQTADVEEAFDALSAGAQEQLSLLVRLGLAEIFAADERLPLILDDALVHTDRDRREAILQLLGRATRHLQILIFTCHDEGYDGLGAHRTYRLPGTRNGR